MAQIDSNKPLPAHTNFNYYECYAKVVLEDIFSPVFNNLLLKDKPDLQDMKTQTGIEVTIAETSETMEAESLYSGLHDVNDVTQSKYL